MSNVLLIVVLVFAKFIDRSQTSDLFLFGVLRKSLLNAIFKKICYFDFGAIFWGIQKTSKIQNHK